MCLRVSRQAIPQTLSNVVCILEAESASLSAVNSYPRRSAAFCLGVSILEGLGLCWKWRRVRGGDGSHQRHYIQPACPGEFKPATISNTANMQGITVVQEYSGTALVILVATPADSLHIHIKW